MKYVVALKKHDGGPRRGGAKQDKGVGITFPLFFPSHGYIFNFFMKYKK
jgi:hypothetical protein